MDIRFPSPGGAAQNSRPQATGHREQHEQQQKPKPLWPQIAGMSADSHRPHCGFNRYVLRINQSVNSFSKNGVNSAHPLMSLRNMEYSGAEWREGGFFEALRADKTGAGHRPSMASRDLRASHRLQQNKIKTFTAEDAEERRGTPKSDKTSRYWLCPRSA